MTIIFKKGNIFSEPVQALVNTVNCVGVMGKGIALAIKDKYPENYIEYKKLCKRKLLKPGTMFIYHQKNFFNSDNIEYIINFPTKNHWRNKSKIEYISLGLDGFIKDIIRLNIKSVAIPPLGCGNGGLDWKDVKKIIYDKLSNVKEVNFIVFEPISFDNQDEPEYEKINMKMTFARAVLLKSLGELEKYFDNKFDRLSLQKIVYFLQELEIQFNLNFSKNLYGPYSEELKKSYINLEKYGMIKGFTSRNKMTHVTQKGFAASNDFLDNINNFDNRIFQRLDHLIQGYESPYGLELLSSVHWIIKNNNITNENQLLCKMNNWSNEKRNKFDNKSIHIALNRLQEDNLINSFL